MNVLWITNNPMSPICEELGIVSPATGGWMFSALKRVKEQNGYTFSVATVYNGSELLERVVDGVTYFMLPLNGEKKTEYNRRLEYYWREIKERFSPDVIHIHGSEFPHGLAYVNACGSDGVVLSVQGLISQIAKYYCDGIPLKILKAPTFRDIIRRDGIIQQQQSFERRGQYEIELLRKIHHVIGRTDWDRANTWAINPNLNYHYCGETLRDSFYHNRWSYDKCRPYTMFLSQANYPIKGLHMVLEAMPIILKQYPTTHIYIGGQDIVHLNWYRISGYGKYLKGLIQSNKLENHITFCGMLPERGMLEQYLSANLFLCPSSIENSSNSLGEAQLLRMPYVASFVGGLPEIVSMNKDALYRFEEVAMLSDKICKIFAEKDCAVAAPYDKMRYDGDLNTRLLVDIYNQI